MPDWINLKENLTNSDKEFFHYKELPDDKALAVVSPLLEIVFCNKKFTELFRLNVKDNLNRLNPGSEFLNFVKGFVESKYKNLKTDLTISVIQNHTDSIYQVDITRIFLSYNQFLLITVESLEQRKIIDIIMTIRFLVFFVILNSFM